MTEQILTTYNNRRTEIGLRFLGFFLPVAAVIATCLAGYFSISMVTVENPLILIFASISILVPFKSENLTTLQKIITLYLFAVLINLTTDYYIALSSLSIDASVSFSIVPLFLCTTGYLLDKLNSNNSRSNDRQSTIFTAWLIALAVIILHMVFLVPILHKFYGYGYGHNLNTIGNLILYLLLAIVLWDKLGSIRFRQCTGTILTAFYLIVFVTNK